MLLSVDKRKQRKSIINILKYKLEESGYRSEGINLFYITAKERTIITKVADSNSI